MTDKRKPQTAARVASRTTSNNKPEDTTPAVGPLAPGQRWSVGRKRDVVLRLLRGESLEVLSRELGVEPYRLAEWREKALLGLEGALKSRGGDALQATLDAAMQRIGELTMANELLWERVRKPGPLPKRRS